MTEQELKDSTSSIARFAVEIIDAKNAEIARLRTALEEIAGYTLESDGAFLVYLAQQALKGGSGD